MAGDDLQSDLDLDLDLPAPHDVTSASLSTCIHVDDVMSCNGSVTSLPTVSKGGGGGGKWPLRLDSSPAQVTVCGFVTPVVVLLTVGE